MPSLGEAGRRDPAHAASFLARARGPDRKTTAVVPAARSCRAERSGMLRRTARCSPWPHAGTVLPLHAGHDPWPSRKKRQHSSHGRKRPDAAHVLRSSSPWTGPRPRPSALPRRAWPHRAGRRSSSMGRRSVTWPSKYRSGAAIQCTKARCANSISRAGTLALCFYACPAFPSISGANVQIPSWR